MKRKPTKKQCRAFRDAVASVIGRAPDDETYCARWVLDTRFGKMDASVHAEEHSTVFLRFHDVTQGVREALPEANPYSGKWNIHRWLHGGATTPEEVNLESESAIAELQRRLKAVS